MLFRSESLRSQETFWKLFLQVVSNLNAQISAVPLLVLFSVPVCYKAIQNPLFSQLAEEVTAQGNQFNPQYIQPMVNKVLDFMDSPLTKQGTVP